MSGSDAIPAAMEESILLDDDGLMSPVTEDLPPESPLAQLDKPDPPLDIDHLDLDLNAGMPESKSMENIMLETSPTSESIDLGSESLAEGNHGASTLESQTEDNDKLGSPETEIAAIEESLERLGMSDQALGEGETSQPRTDNQDDDVKTPKAEADTVKDISSYFTMSEGPSGSDFFDTLSAPVDPFNKVDEAHMDEIHRKRTISTSSVGATEATTVSFEEVKGEGMKFVGSMANVSQFFTDDAEKDEEAKDFFEKFTAAETDGLDPIKSPKQDMTVAPSGSVSIPETPPIPAPSSPVPSPAHHAGPRSRTTSMSSPMPSPAHMFTQAEPPLPTPETAVMSPPVQSAFQGEEDVFSASLSMSDTDRRNDAWIPSEPSRQVLVSMVTSSPGTYFPDHDQLTMPGLLIDDPQGDPVKDLVARFMGEQEAAKRVTQTPDEVTQDEAGLRKLIAAECYRAAIDLTGRLLTLQGQGANKVNVASKHTPQSLQVWFCRIALLMKLRLYSHAESECQAFGNLDRPDLYYDFYPDVYYGRRGCMVPFAFRLLHAELPQYLGKSQESLDRLYYIHAITVKVLSNLESGLAEDGSMLTLSEDSRKASRELWESREVHLLYAIGNCLLNIKDYMTALTIFESLLKKDRNNSAALLPGIGRIYLQMGDMRNAQKYFEKFEAESGENHSSKIRALMNKGFIALGNNQFSEAQQFFQQAVEADPKNAVAVNNMAVCWLYMGKLREALKTLEDLVQKDPANFLQEGILFNLCTLYELESSRAMVKKQALLELVSKHKGNGFNTACLKMT